MAEWICKKCFDKFDGVDGVDYPVCSISNIFDNTCIYCDRVADSYVPDPPLALPVKPKRS